MIKRPMKAPSECLTDEQLEQLNYPLLGSPKLDGFRCVVIGGRPYTSSMKFFQNEFVKKELSHPAFEGLDGELIVGNPTDRNVFHNTSGPLRRWNGEPDFKFYAFDSVKDVDSSYNSRWLSFLEHRPTHPRLVLLEQRGLYHPSQVLEYEKEMLSYGYEGAMIRSRLTPYKQGRCTFKEQSIFKRKPFVECEAIIIGFEEAQQNMNEPEMNELGLMKRSSHKENKEGKDTLGSLILKSKLWPTHFNARLGKGFTAADNQGLWDNKNLYLGKVVTVKYQKYGSMDAPRIPTVIKFRPDWDLSEEV